MTSGRIIGIFFFSVIAILLILGLIIELTPLLNNGYHTDDEDTDIASKKNIIGKILICFSPSRNVIQLFFPKIKEDDHLMVLNGLRVFS